MFRQLTCLVVLIAIACESYSECQAQIVRRIIERRASVREAAAREAADPQAAEAVTPAATTLRARIAARAAAREEQAAGSPTPRTGRDAGAEREGLGSDAPPFTAQRPPSRPDSSSGVDQASAAFAVGTPTVPTERDLAAMEVSGLARVLQTWNDQLAIDLESFTTSESWQRYLLLPEGLIDLGAIQPDGLNRLQSRFDKVAQDPKFEQISSLPSFDATHRVLQRLGMEINGPALLDASGAALESDPSQGQAVEVLPLPQAYDHPSDSEGERSILLRD